MIKSSHREANKDIFSFFVPPLPPPLLLQLPSTRYLRSELADRRENIFNFNQKATRSVCHGKASCPLLQTVVSLLHFLCIIFLFIDIALKGYCAEDWLNPSGHPRLEAGWGVAGVKWWLFASWSLLGTGCMNGDRHRQEHY